MTNAAVATARAQVNIALAKYWGKADPALNLPAVPSLSLTLDGPGTETTVRFDPRLRADRVRLDGRDARGREAARVVALLDDVRREAGLRWRAEVVSENDVPTASGLASSASGFAALAAAAATAAGLPPAPGGWSRLARRASASAARSIFGGFVELPAGRAGDDRLCARPIALARRWDVRMVLALTSADRKPVSSTEGMERARRTSPYYEAWLDAAPRLARAIRRAVRARDLASLGPAMEASALAFHACALTSAPPIVYFNPTTLAVLSRVRSLREARGVLAYATMDAGPHVKVLCRAEDARAVARALRRVPGVLATRIAAPGPGVVVTRSGQ